VVGSAAFFLTERGIWKDRKSRPICREHHTTGHATRPNRGRGRRRGRGRFTLPRAS